MTKFKKIILFCSMVCVVVICTSFSAFAQNVNFTLPTYPTGNMSNTSTTQSYSAIILTPSDEYRYVEVVVNRPSSSNTFADRFKLSPLVWSNVSTSVFGTDYCYLLPTLYMSNPDSGPWGMNFKFFVYDTSGNLINTNNVGWYDFLADFYNKSYCVGKLLFGVTSTTSNYQLSCQLKDAFSFVIVSPNSIPIQGGPSFSNNPQGYTIRSNSLYYDFVNDTDGSCSLTDDIYINGVLVYEGGSVPISYIINGIQSGTLVPEYTNGVLTGYLVNNEISIDMSEYASAIAQMKADDLEIPSLSFDSDDEFPSVEFDDDDLDELDIMSGGTALTWFYARLNDVSTNNVKILSLMVSCLSLGFISLILNKRT